MGEDWRESRLTCYAHLETERWCYSRAEGAGVTVVVDVTDWGYRVGEIEMVVESKAEVPAAVERIEEIAKELGEKTESRFLSQFCTVYYSLSCVPSLSYTTSLQSLLLLLESGLPAASLLLQITLPPLSPCSFSVSVDFVSLNFAKSFSFLLEE